MFSQRDGEKAHLRRRKQPKRSFPMMGKHPYLQGTWAQVPEESFLMGTGDPLQDFEGSAGPKATSRVAVADGVAWSGKG